MTVSTETVRIYELLIDYFSDTVEFINGPYEVGDLFGHK